MRFAVFFGALTIILGLLAFYVHTRTAKAFALSRKARRVLATLFACGILSMFATRLLGHLAPATLVRMLGLLGTVTVLSILLCSVLFALLVDLPRGIAALGRLLFRHASPKTASAPDDLSNTSVPPASPSPAIEPSQSASPLPQPPAPQPSAPAALTIDTDPPPPPPRRLFLSQVAAGSALFAGIGTSVYGAALGRHDYAIEEVPVRIPGLPPTLDGFTIVQLSDIHFGIFVGEPEIRMAEELVRKARPDLIVLTGDLIDFDVHYKKLLGQLVRKLGPVARAGVVAIPGNHDYFAGIHETLQAVRDAGGDCLVNQGRVIGDNGGQFALLGVDDLWARRNGRGRGPDLSQALTTVPSDLPRILLCHNPAYFPDAAGQIALQLSGHTHGGQFNPLIRLGDLVLPYGYVQGLYKRGESTLYVNRGFGTAGPAARLGSRPEVSRIVLVAS